MGAAACNLAPPDETLFGETGANTEPCTGETCASNTEQDDDTPTIITDWAGNLEVDMNSSADFLTNLQTISGDLNIGPGLDISLPALKSVAGDLLMTSNDAILTLSMANLETIGGNLELRMNNRMTTLDLPKLNTVAMGIRVALNRSIQTINIDSLISSGLSCAITNNEALQTLNMDSFNTAGLGLEIKDNESLPTCMAQSIADQLTSGSATISGNDSTATCDE